MSDDKAWWRAFKERLFGPGEALDKVLDEALDAPLKERLGVAFEARRKALDEEAIRAALEAEARLRLLTAAPGFSLPPLPQLPAPPQLPSLPLSWRMHVEAEALRQALYDTASLSVMPPGIQVEIVHPEEPVNVRAEAAAFERAAAELESED